MDRRHFLSYAATVAAVSFSRPLLAEPPQEKAKDLSDLLETIRKEHDLPGIAAAGVSSGRLVAEGVAGVRRIGKDDPITLDNRFGMASCTKRMTASMVCRVIDSGKLSFDTTLAEAIPAIDIRDEYKAVTVAQLLNHTGGLPSYLQSDELARKLPKLHGSPAERREQFIKLVLQEEPVVKPGTEPRYSNAGYALVGFVAEQRAGRSWEDLMTSEIFQPLGMKNAGFGRPFSKDRQGEPLLHHKGESGYEPEAEDRDNALEILAPAGNVHCSIRDFARFAIYELGLARGTSTLLQPETAKRFQELTRRRTGGPGAKTGGGKLGAGKKTKTTDAAKSKAGKRPPTTPAFFGGSNFISSGCMLWADQNQSVVVAINGGGAHAAINTAFEQIKERLTS